LSETNDFNQLLNEKTRVVNESRELDEEQRQLKLRAKILTEKIVQELRIKNNSKRANVYLLQSTIKDLESQLNALTVSTVLEDNNEETAEATETVSEETVETVETTVNFPEETAEAVVTTHEESLVTLEETVTITDVAEEINTET
jgi:ribosomal protein L14E/L6E/L27E